MKLGLNELQGEKSLLVVGSWMNVCRQRGIIRRQVNSGPTLPEVDCVS